MKNRALLSAVALCFLVAGCESKKEEPVKPKVADKVVPLPVAAPTPPPASAAQDAKPGTAPVAQAMDTGKSGATATTKAALKPACKNGNNCTVELTVTGDTAANCRITKSAMKLFVARGRAETVHWKINNAGKTNWDFDANGIAFPGSTQFSCSANGPNRYKCDDRNTDTTHTPHPYFIKLKAPGQTCNNDPMIVNGADDQNSE